MWLCAFSQAEEDMEAGEEASTARRDSRRFLSSFSKRKVIYSHWALWSGVSPQPCPPCCLCESRVGSLPAPVTLRFTASGQSTGSPAHPTDLLQQLGSGFRRVLGVSAATPQLTPSVLTLLSSTEKEQQAQEGGQRGGGR